MDMVERGKHIWKLEMTGNDSRVGNLKTVSRICLKTSIWEGSVFRL